MFSNDITKWKHVQKSSGTKIDPWGTPQEIETDDENNCPIATENVLSLRYKSNQSSAVSLRPTLCPRRERRVLWSTMSEVVLRSSKTKTALSTESTASSKLLITFNKGVSVPWFVVKPDWNGAWVDFKKGSNCDNFFHNFWNKWQFRNDMIVIQTLCLKIGVFEQRLENCML